MADDDSVKPIPEGPELDREDYRELARQLEEQAGGPHEALAMIEQWIAATPSLFHAARPQPELLPRRAERAAFVVRVDLDGAKPPIWRRLRLASDLTLDRLHEILQVAMGWSDSHLHQFKAGPEHKDYQMVPFTTAWDIEEGEDEGIPEADVRLDEVLAEPGHRLFYEYDFGDSWEHTIKLEKVEPWRDDDPVAHCLAGRRACPPEDVGGIGGYGSVLDALAGELDEDEPEWMPDQLAALPPDFDPGAFDRDEVNSLLTVEGVPDLTAWHPRITALILREGGSVLSPVTRLITRATAARVEFSDDEARAAAHQFVTLLDTVGDGLTLTAAGYLPPRVVESLFNALEFNDRWIGRGNREDLTPPVGSLRAAATSLGLVRKAHNRLTVTATGRKVATDAHALLRHVAERLPAGRRNFEQDAGLLALLRAADGRPVRWDDEDFGALFALTGWFSNDGRQATAAYQSARPTLDVLEHLAGQQPSAAALSRIANLLLQRGNTR